MRRPITPWVLCIGAAGALVPACTNPFTSDESDYGYRVPLDRFKELETVNLEKYRREHGARPLPDITRPGEAERLTAEARQRFEAMGRADLTLEQCRASALANNLDLKVALVSPAIARQSISEEEGRFDAAFTLRALYQNNDSATASSLESAQSNFGLVEPGVRLPLRTGETINVSLPASRSETDNAFSTLNPSYAADLKFSVTQPLLRGAGRRANTAGIRIASYTTQAVASQTRLEAIRQLAAVDRSYWRLYQARQNLDVTQQQYELAEAQLRRAERRAAAGGVAEIEVIRAQSGRADRMEAIIVAQNDVLRQQRELKRIVNMPGLEIDSTALVVPGTLPDPVEYVFDTRTLTDRAVANRMEMLELELRLAADAVNIDLARNRALPLFTLDYTYNVNGLGATRNRSFKSLSQNDFEDWSIGLSAEVPIGNNTALSGVRRAVLQRVQRLATREARELAIRQEVLDAVDSIQAGWQRVLAARQASILSARTLAAEQRQFDVGASTSTNVLDQATRLAEAQLAEIRALTDYQISQVDLAFATGTLLGAGKIRFESLDDPDADIQFKRDALRIGPGEEDEQVKTIRVPEPQPPSEPGESTTVVTPALPPQSGPPGAPPPATDPPAPDPK